MTEHDGVVDRGIIDDQPHEDPILNHGHEAFLADARGTKYRELEHEADEVLAHHVGPLDSETPTPGPRQLPGDPSAPGAPTPPPGPDMPGVPGTPQTPGVPEAPDVPEPSWPTPEPEEPTEPQIPLPPDESRR